MLTLNTHFIKIFALSTLSILLTACGGGGGNDNSGGTTPPPVTNSDLFTVKAKQWVIQPATNTSYCYDIDTQTQINCEGSDWDLKFAMGTRGTPLLFTNSGVSGSGTGGALYSPFDGKWDTLSKELDATQKGTLPSSAWLVDGYSNAFMDTSNGGFNSFFEYDLFGDHRMSPNFKMYLLTTDKTKTDTVGTAEKPVFALQIADYYKGTASGNITLRYLNTLDTNAEAKVLSIDATQGWNYVNLVTGQVSTSSVGQWHIAFNRYNVQVNSDVGATVASQPAGFYDANGKVILDKFKDTSAVTTTLTDLKNAAAVKVTKWGSNTVTSVLNPNFQGTYPNKLSYGWYNYYPTITAAQADGLQAAHVLAANPNAASVIRGNKANSYARLHLKSIAYADPTNNASATTWTFEFDIQPVK